jgi:LacI family transcriptional regulator
MAFMPQNRRKRRVTIMRQLQQQYDLPMVEAIVDYGRHIGDWQFVGRGATPFADPEELGDYDADGVIVALPDPEVYQAIRDAGSAAVSISWGLLDVPIARTADDDAAIGRMGAEYLLRCGFSEFAFFGQPEDQASDPRCQAFVQVIDEAGRRCQVRDHIDDGSKLIGERLAGWLAELPKPIAVMGYRDFMARLTVNAAVASGLRVPDDVAVLGVGDNPWTSIMAATPVSSIQLDRRRVGRVAAETLDGLMAGGTAPPMLVVPPLGVVTRHSTDIMLIKDRVVADALAYIRDHCGQGLCVDDVVEHLDLDMSRRTFEKRMKKAMGMAPGMVINRAQVDRAKKMLADLDTPIETIARACGFSQPARLNEAFKRITGMTPGQYRRQRAS